MGGSNQSLFLIGSIVEAVIAMARGLKVGVFAEGVETREQAELLVRMGCTRCQGFLFSRRVHAREIDVMLTGACEEWWPQPAKLVAGPRG
jgi:EAL domain-containing protein (putative c-di-GMP-specific phosphodiesterase class I)